MDLDFSGGIILLPGKALNTLDRQVLKFIALFGFDYTTYPTVIST